MKPDDSFEGSTVFCICWLNVLNDKYPLKEDNVCIEDDSCNKNNDKNEETNDERR